MFPKWKRGEAFVGPDGRSEATDTSPSLRKERLSRGRGGDVCEAGHKAEQLDYAPRAGNAFLLCSKKLGRPVTLMSTMDPILCCLI